MKIFNFSGKNYNTKNTILRKKERNRDRITLLNPKNMKLEKKNLANECISLNFLY